MSALRVFFVYLLQRGLFFSRHICHEEFVWSTIVLCCAVFYDMLLAGAWLGTENKAAPLTLSVAHCSIAIELFWWCIRYILRCKAYTRPPVQVT